MPDRGKRPHLLHGLWRTLMFAGCTAAFWLTVWINILIFDGRMLHDRLSATLVIKRN